MKESDSWKLLLTDCDWKVFFRFEINEPSEWLNWLSGNRLDLERTPFLDLPIWSSHLDLIWTSFRPPQAMKIDENRRSKDTHKINFTLQSKEGVLRANQIWIWNRRVLIQNFGFKIFKVIEAYSKHCKAFCWHGLIAADFKANFRRAPDELSTKDSRQDSRETLDKPSANGSKNLSDFKANFKANPD